FKRMPLEWQRAFGGNGWGRNPIGKGFPEPGGAVQVLPNIEDPRNLIKSQSDRPEPSGYGSYDPSWPQRASKLGTYGREWLENESPGFATDLDVGFFNAAPEDQQISGFFNGDELLIVENMHEDVPRLECHLPGLSVRIFINNGASDATSDLKEVPARLDTVR